MNNKSEIDEILNAGAEKVRPLASANLARVKKAIGVTNG